MKTIQRGYHTAMLAVVTLIGMLLAAPKAIGLTLLYYSDFVSPAQFGDGGPSDLKALNDAMEKAFKAMGENIKQVQDIAENAREEVRKEGTLHGKTNDQLTELGKKGNELADGFKEVRERVLAVEQKLAAGKGNDDDLPASVAELVTKSEQFKVSAARGAEARVMEAVNVKSFHHKAPIINAVGQNQPLVYSQRLPGIIVPATQRMTIRDLLPVGQATSNLIEYCQEATFTNAATVQGGPTSPVGNGEGDTKAESAMTFTLANSPVVTLAHWIPASRQVLSDAPLLQGHINGRLIYGLKLEEERELLLGTGAAGQLNGLVNQATAFTGGGTNQTALDTMLKAMLQVSLSFYEVSAFVLHPTDWTNMILLKDTTGRYLFSDPQNMVEPRVWAKPVVATPSMNTNKFLAGAFDLAAQIWDKEDATVRISENVNDHFIRNMVAILAEERLAITVYRAAAIVYGSVTTAG